MKKIFDILYRRLIILLLPTFLRTKAIISFLHAFVAPLERTHDLFMTSARYDRFRENIDSSIPRLEYLLNSVFYPDGLNVAYNRRIVIGDLESIQPARIFLAGIMQEIDEGRPQFLNPEKYIYRISETTAVVSDFVIKVPSEVQFDHDYMKTIVSAYALPGKNFEIVKY